MTLKPRYSYSISHKCFIFFHFILKKLELYISNPCTNPCTFSRKIAFCSEESQNENKVSIVYLFIVLNGEAEITKWFRRRSFHRCARYQKLVNNNSNDLVWSLGKQMFVDCIILGTSKRIDALSLIGILTI